MDYEEENLEKQGQEESSFNSAAGKKGKSKLLDMMRDDKKKKQKKKIPSKQEIIKKVISIGIKVIIVILGFFFLAGFHKIIKDNGESKTNNAKAQAITTTYVADASTTGTDQDGNTVSKVAVTTNANKTGYEIIYNNDSQYLEEVKEELEEQTDETVADFTNFELGLLGSLMDNGSNFEYYSLEELHCFDEFIKAEACTQNLDLRPNSKKIVNGEYVPQKIEDLAENEVPGVVLVQRTNTNGDTSTILEYKQKDGENGFDKLIQEGNQDALNYFTIDEKGNLIIAKWSKEDVKIEPTAGDYNKLSDDIKTELESQDKVGDNQYTTKYVLTPEPIAYSQYIAKYKMPFEFLIQLLVITEETDFCMELVDYVLNSKIVINIQEEETITVTDETRDYTIHSKDEKYINYEINAAGQQIAKVNNHLLKYAKDDEQDPGDENNCTSYSNEKVTIKVTTTDTSHSYVFEITEVDTWLAHYKKTYANKDPEGPTELPVSDPGPNENAEYKQIESENKYPITDEKTINKDKHVKEFIEKTETNYNSTIKLPTINIKDNIDSLNNKFKTVEVSGTTGPYQPYYEVKDEYGNGTGVYNLPKTWKVTTNKISSTDKTEEIPPLQYTFELETRKNIITGQVTSYYYKLAIETDSISECKVSSLDLKQFKKIVLDNYIETTVTKHPSDPNPVTETHIYARDNNDNLEKFLVAYDNSEGAQNQINSIDSWLFEMMEDNEATVELVDIVKYLLYLYDYVDRGVTELEGFNDLFKPEEFISVTSGIYGNTIEEKVWWALIDAGFSKEAAAGAMGNFWAESGFRTNNLENSYEINGEHSLGYTDETYTQAINDNTYTREQFISDHVKNKCGAGYGLAQWTYYSRKAGLYDFAKDEGVSIDDENMQIDYLIGELTGQHKFASCVLSDNEKKGFTVEDWKNASSPEEAAEAFCWIFENPKKYNESRGTKAREYYNRYKDQNKVSGSSLQVANGTAQEKLKYLFPNGLPTTKAEAMKYMVSINVPITTKQGKKTTANIMVHKAVAQDVIDVFQAAQDSGFKIYSVGGFSFRTMNNGSAKPSLSHHSYGIAIDINPNENYSIKNGKVYAGSFWDPKKSEYSIPANGVLVKAFEQKGWKWGAYFSDTYHDYMHFSFTGN